MRRVWASVIASIALSILAVFATIVALGDFQNKDLHNCVHGSRALGTVLHMYAHDYDGAFPPIHPEPGRLMFAAASVYDTIITTPWIVICPSQRERIRETYGEKPTDIIDDFSYVYLRHAILDEDHFDKYVDAYTDAVEKGLSLNGNLQGQDGTIFYALRLGSEFDAIYQKIGQTERSIPVFVERPGHHRRSGLVVYVDGHVEILGLNEAFPFTDSFFEAVARIDALKPPVKTKRFSSLTSP